MFNPNCIIAFDLDGTLLNDNRLVSSTDLKTLKALGNLNYVRVAATGRNLFSVKRIIPLDFPIDFVVFSSGAGILEWRTMKILKKAHLSQTDIATIVNCILPYKLNFTINLSIPNNHKMLLFDNHDNPDDLIAYTSFYKTHVHPLQLEQLPEKATQIIVLLNSTVHLFSEIQQQLLPLKCILTTSPINHKSMWMEIFNPIVSKAAGIQWIKEYLQLDKSKTFAIGNDYNDTDMLEYADYSFTVSNAPDLLKQKFNVSKSNNDSGFSFAINLLSHELKLD